MDEEDIYLASDEGEGPQVTDRVDEEDHNLLDYEPVDAQEYIERTRRGRSCWPAKGRVSPT